MKSFNILTGNDINREMISEAIQLDRISYDDMYQLQVDSCFDYFKKNNNIYIMTIDNELGHVIGYINYSPIKEKVYRNLICGNMIDTLISSDDILSYKDGICYWGYFSSIVVHPEYRQYGIATQMFIYWFDMLLQLAQNRSIYFKGIVADAISDIGIYLLSKMGFSSGIISSHRSTIMFLDLFSENIISSKFNDKVITVYKKYKLDNYKNKRKE